MGHHKGTRENPGPILQQCRYSQSVPMYLKAEKSSWPDFVQCFRYSLGICHVSFFCFVRTTEPSGSLRSFGIYLQEYKDIQTNGVTEEFRHISCESVGSSLPEFYILWLDLSKSHLPLVLSVDGEHSSTKPVWNVDAIQEAHCTYIAALGRHFSGYPQAWRNRHGATWTEREKHG